VIHPINDYPSVVRGETLVLVEYYGLDKGALRAVASNGESATWEIHDEQAAALLELDGTLVDEHKGTESSDKADTNALLNEGEELVTVYRMRTKIQDVDFFFGYNLNITGHFIRATFVPDVYDVSRDLSKRQQPEAEDDLSHWVYVPPCIFVGDRTVSCISDVSTVNEFLQNEGLPIVVAAGVSNAVGLFLIYDHGSIDKWDRPLEGGFTITLIPPSTPEGLVVPIAAAVILPVIAAATAAAIAAAWIALGQRAADYAGASFDAFGVQAAGGSSVSPLYDSRGLEVQSTLYTGGN